MKEVKQETIESKPLASVPDFYRSPTGNALNDTLRGARPVYRDFISLVDVQDFTTTLAAYDPMSGIFDSKVLRGTHSVQGNIPFVFIYAKTGDYYTQCPYVIDFDAGQVAATAAHVENASFYFTVYNFDESIQTVEFRAFIYRLSSKV